MSRRLSRWLLELLPCNRPLLAPLLLIPPLVSVLLRQAMIGGIYGAFCGRLVHTSVLACVFHFPHLKAKWPVGRIQNRAFVAVFCDEDEGFSIEIAAGFTLLKPG